MISAGKNSYADQWSPFLKVVTIDLPQFDQRSTCADQRATYADQRSPVVVLVVVVVVVVVVVGSR